MIIIGISENTLVAIDTPICPQLDPPVYAIVRA